MANTNIAIACQGGGSHAAYSAGVLPALLPLFQNEANAGEAGGQGRDKLHLVGISGTSGGAITALLAWYGYLTGGTEQASANLAGFWDSNCARLYGEQAWNTSMLDWANSLQYDLKFSPYLSPLFEFETVATALWPQVARYLGDYNKLIGEKFFQLGELIRPYVDFSLIEALGDFASIPLEIKRWTAADLEARMSPPDSARRQQLEQARHLAEDRIERKLTAPRQLHDLMEATDTSREALLSVALARWREPEHAFDGQSLQELSKAVLEVTRLLPQLLVGAVEIGNGEFTAFSSERSPVDGGISLEAVLASAALPWLFQAQRLVQIDPDTDSEKIHSYWDGLFSQNPPIRNFMSGVLDESKKPDAIWVVQINPDDFYVETVQSGKPRDDALSGSQIWHTRDALAGNLSLNQEVAFVEAINKRIDEGGATGASDKHIQVHRIVMDAAAVEAKLGRKLGVYSKFDRSLGLKDALVEHGRTQAGRFLALREEVEHAGGNLGTMLHQLAPPAAEAARGAAGVPVAPRHDAGASGAQLMVDGLTVHHEAASAAGPMASVRWHTRGANLNGSKVTIEGNSSLYAEGAGDRNWQLCEVRVRAIGHAHS